MIKVIPIQKYVIDAIPMAKRIPENRSGRLEMGIRMKAMVKEDQMVRRILLPWGRL